MEHSGINVDQQEIDFSIVTPRLTIEALRDAGYKNTDHALAELIDNSVEADATLVEVIAVEAPPNPEIPYARSRINEIAIADNGVGMDATILRRALKFGDGTRLTRETRGIGRFGIGLPQSSMSQCTRVDIWTWRNGADNAWHCHLDLQEIKDTNQLVVPEPFHDRVPDRWRSVTENFLSESGTLVVWSNLDRVRWRTGTTTLQHTATLCGRIYRKFLSNDSNPLQIKLKNALNRNDCLQTENEVNCLPNDPLFLTKSSATPAPFDDKPMFRHFNDRCFTVPVDRNFGEITVRCALARKEAINNFAGSEIPWPKSYTKAGAAPWGKHADRNKGVSIVRAKRELELSTAWVNNYEPEERWWSVEVEFDPILDEIFGVVNNKQHAHLFTEGAGFNWEEDKNEGESYYGYIERLKETLDPKQHLIDVWKFIDEQIPEMRKERKIMMKGTGKKTRHSDSGKEVEDTTTDVIVSQAAEGDRGETDNAPSLSPEDKEQMIVDSLVNRDIEKSVALEWARETIENNRRVMCKAVSLDHNHAFFDVELLGDIIWVRLNTVHPVYEHLIEVLESDLDHNSNIESLIERIQKSNFVFRMLLIAWARYEDKLPSTLRANLADTRMDWGREARKFLEATEA